MYDLVPQIGFKLSIVNGYSAAKDLDTQIRKLSDTGILRLYASVTIGRTAQVYRRTKDLKTVEKYVLRVT